MGLKPDHWIRRMALERGMIEPFVEKQVREGVISYGLSSYGYDLRVADEFKVFTDVYGAIVDPKGFAPNSFVDFKTDVCVVPPNSFALARSIEYFRIPANVLTICLGKSTYARCFRGDTRVALVDGTNPTLEEMVVRAEKGEAFWGYSVGEFGRIIVTLLEAPRYIGRDALIEVTLDDGATIQCTLDHKFVMRDGTSLMAHELRPDMPLMPLYRQIARGYEMLYQPLNGQMHPTHRLADEWNVRHGLYTDIPGTHRHHRDFNRRNNNPWNIERMKASDHIRLHNEQTYKTEDFDPVEHGNAVKESIRRLWENDAEWRAEFSRQQREKTLRFWRDEDMVEARQRRHEAELASWTDERRQIMSERVRKYYEDPVHRQEKSEQSKAAWAQDDGQRRAMQQEIARNIRLRSEVTEEIVRAALDQTGSIRGAARLLDCDRATFRRFPGLLDEFRGKRTKYRSEKYRNHKVASIRELPGDHDTYCLTVPEAGNFALQAGVFVHNCGLIVNVTPFEPGWEGYVTLEISNTTPLPAKVYANEGLCQVLFFEGDEPCETTYADRKGKYQGQTGVTPPRL
ncbi:MAG: dCTP deaminase [Chloroflexota bacterium]|nr:dCTP deaminase [Chloroflexota bacterium]